MTRTAPRANCRLTIGNVRAIRRARGALRAIAARFGVSYETARRIRLRKAWQWLK